MPYQPVEDVFEGDWDLVRRNFASLRRDMNPFVPQVRVFNNANLSIPNGAVTALTFNSERYDNGALHSTSVNSGRLTIPITGLYSIGCCVEFAANATGIRSVLIRYLGTTTIGSSDTNATSAGATIVQAFSESQFIAGDWVDVAVFQNSGGALNVQSTSAYSPELWVHRVAGFVNQGV